MTQIVLVAVGRLKPGPLTELADTYLKRFTLGSFGPIRVIEVEARGNFPPEVLKQREADEIEAKLPLGATLVALDERGKIVSSRGLATWIGQQRDEGTQSLAFVIGGADGLDERIRAKAKLTLAFGQMTWPHMLVRVMLLEQLYRAQQIIAGHPYHRE